jgi:hypothetical protein
VDLYDDASTCQYVIFPQGGNYRFNDADNPNYDNMQNWRVSGQMAQGNGANWMRGGMRARNASYFAIEYMMSYRFAGDGYSFFGSSDMMNSRHSYVRHVSVAWGETTSRVQVSINSGTESVPQLNDTSEYHTYQNLLVGEPEPSRPLGFIAGGMEEPDNKQRYLTLMGTYFHGSGHRMPNMSAATKAQFIRLVSYNSVSRSGELGRASHQDVIDYMMRPGPMTPAIGTPGVVEESGWPLIVLGGGLATLIRNGNSDSTYLANNTTLSDSEAGFLASIATPDTASWYLYGIRGPQNSYAVGADSIDLWRGAQRVTACGDGHVWFHTAYTSGDSFCEADGDSLPLDATNDTLMRNYVRWVPLDSAAPTADADPTPTDEFTDTAVANVLRFAGNSRYLTCSGEWTFRADSVATRWRQEWVDSTDAGDHTSGGGVERVLRGWGATPGTACTDTDNDGLPDAYESANSASTTALAVDDRSYGRPAIEWYLDGRNTDATLVGCEDLSCAAEGGVVSASFGAVSRYAYFVPMTTMFGISFPLYDSIQNIAYGILNPTEDTMMVVSCNADAGAPADSSTIDGRVVAWNRPGINTATLVRDFTPFTGMGC